MNIESVDGMQIEADMDMLSEIYWQVVGRGSDYEEHAGALSRIYDLCERVLKSGNVVENAPALIVEADLAVGDPCRTLRG